MLSEIEKRKAFDLLLTHEGVLYGALRKAHVTKRHPYFDDLVQEGCLTFLQAYELKKETLTPETESAFLNFAFTRIYWQTLNQLTHSNLKVNHQEKRSFEETAYLIPDKTANFETALLRADLNLLWPKLTPTEQNYLILTLQEQQTISEIARRNQVSRQSIYRLRNRIALKFLALNNNDSNV